ncbi:hypothetical protein I5189_04197 [Pseudomonas aeruginosa]|nr:hypothetical protein [Pseudomonas aeruginosa]OKN99709.1 hypothetical protein AM482_005951 [Pseudomonas aeruginosa]OKO08830.1 hypothetical protein AM482_004948 [Pseudomonas aeruginosa]OKO09257.1 hypothetical protein AM482_005381 [Pseudomonas aeruginosa]
MGMDWLTHGAPTFEVELVAIRHILQELIHSHADIKAVYQLHIADRNGMPDTPLKQDIGQLPSHSEAHTRQHVSVRKELRKVLRDGRDHCWQINDQCWVNVEWVVRHPPCKRIGPVHSPPK